MIERELYRSFALFEWPEFGLEFTLGRWQCIESYVSLESREIHQRPSIQLECGHTVSNALNSSGGIQHHCVAHHPEPLLHMGREKCGIRLEIFEDRLIHPIDIQYIHYASARTSLFNITIWPRW